MVLQGEELLHVERLGNPATLAGLGVAAVVSLLVLRYPKFGLSLLVLLVYLDLSEVLVRHHGFPSLLQLLVFPLGLCAIADAGQAANGPPQARRATAGPLPWLLALYLAVVLFSTTLARDVRLADERFGELMRAMILFLLILWLATSVERVRAAAWAILGGGALLGGLGVAQALSGAAFGEFGGLARIKEAHIYGRVFESRIAGPLGDPNYFAQILVMAVPLGLYLAWRETSPRRRVLAYALAGLAGSGALLTYSRGGALALAAVLGLCLLDHRVRARHVALGLVVVAMLLPLMPSAVTSRLATLQEILPGGEEVIHPDSSFAKRKMYVLSAWSMFLDHPVAGVGVGNYSTHFEEYAGEVGSTARLYWEDLEGRRYPHNLYLEAASETGLLGLGVLGAAFAASFLLLRAARARFLSGGDAMGEGLCAAFSIALAGTLICGLFLHDAFPRYLWLLLGFCAALHRISFLEGQEEAA